MGNEGFILLSNKAGSARGHNLHEVLAGPKNRRTSHRIDGCRVAMSDLRAEGQAEPTAV